MNYSSSCSMKEVLFFEARQNTSGDDKYPFTLAVNGDSENFYLCQSRTSSEVLVVYNPLDAGSPGVGFDTTSCTDVYIHIIPKSK